jgi:hypothetical protein
MQDFERLALGREVTGIGIGSKVHPNWHWHWHWQIVSSIAEKHVWSTERPAGPGLRSLAAVGTRIA